MIWKWIKMIGNQLRVVQLWSQILLKLQIKFSEKSIVWFETKLYTTQLNYHYFFFFLEFRTAILFRNWIYKGYYMAVLRYGFYLLDNISYEWAKRTSERCFQHKKIKSVSPSDHVVFFLFYEIFIVKRN